MVLIDKAERAVEELIGEIAIGGDSERLKATPVPHKKLLRDRAVPCGRGPVEVIDMRVSMREEASKLVKAERGRAQPLDRGAELMADKAPFPKEPGAIACALEISWKELKLV